MGDAQHDTAVERGRRKNDLARDPILSAAACRVATPRDGRLHSWLRWLCWLCWPRGPVAHAGTWRDRDGKAQRAELLFDVSAPLAIRVSVIGAAPQSRVRFDEVAARMDDVLLRSR